MKKKIVKIEAKCFDLMSLKVPKWTRQLNQLHAAGPSDPKKRDQFRNEYILAKENLDRIVDLRKMVTGKVGNARQMYGKAELMHAIDEDRSQTYLRKAVEDLESAEELIALIKAARKLRKKYYRRLKKMAQ